MAAGWRATARLVATAVAASAVSRAAESLRRLVAEVEQPELNGPVSAPASSRRLEPASSIATTPTPAPAPRPARTVTAQARPPHEFGPTPVVTPSRGIGFRSEPPRPRAEMPVISRPGPEHDDLDEPELGTVAEPVVVPDGVRTAAAIVHGLDGETDDTDDADDTADDEMPDEETPLPADPPAVEIESEPQSEPQPAQKASKPDKGKHRRRQSALSGTVTSSRGRGLRGMRVSVLDDHGQTVGTAVTGGGGAFVVEDLAAGRFVVAVTDDDGDFAPAWHGGSSETDAAGLKVKDGKTRRKADVAMVANASIDLDVDLRKKKAVVGIRVTDRASGTPATGVVRVSTKLFSTDLPLTDGQATITLRGSADGSPALSKKLRVDYRGSEHTQPVQASVKLR